MTATNANSKLLAAVLNDAKAGFTGLITTKVGVTRGKGAAKMVYGDDTIHTVIVTGFKYENLVAKSLAAVNDMTDDAVIAKALTKGVTVDAATVAVARAELVDSFTSSLAGTNESTTDAVYEPLVVDGETVRGARVYKCVGTPACHCRNCTGDEKAPLTGTIYLQGIRVWSKVLVAAVNGPAPEPKSAAKTVAKDIIRGSLPVAKYVSYRLEPGTSFALRAGGTAEVEATNKGFTVTDEIMDVIAKVA